MRIVDKKLEELKVYENNPRNNLKAIQLVANSIKQFGFRIPIIIDKNNVIVAGHTRYKASILLELKVVPCIIVDDLTDEQIRLFRIIDNKSNEVASWDYILLQKELDGINNINMQDFGFEENDIDWDSIDEIGADNYEKPSSQKWQCPYCQHIDEKIRFKKVDV